MSFFCALRISFSVMGRNFLDNAAMPFVNGSMTRTATIAIAVCMTAI